MTDATLTIIATSLPPTLVAFGALIVGVINSLKANKIHVLVNSNLTAVKADLLSANQKIEALQATLVKQETAHLAARATDVSGNPMPGP